MSECTGNGECLTQGDNENDYEKREDINCIYNCRPIQCCNWVFCKQWLPGWFFGLKHANVCICINCDMVFGKKLEMVDNIECPVCYETTRCVVRPKCLHVTCILCFKRCMYGDAGLEYAFAPFPYGEDAYEEWIDGWDDDGDEIDNGVLLEKYPEALEWHILNEARQMVLDEQIADEANLRVCPICRR